MNIQRVGIQTKDPERLEYWGLPVGVCEQLTKHTGIKRLFPWQAECLSISPAVIEGKSNLVYFAPTSGGKSIVSEILMLRAILGFKKRAIYILPYVSIVSEKT
jgi:replicative superfamily II helicase